MKYKVRFYQDDIYEVWKCVLEVEIPVFKGTLADCEAWIRLHEAGYM